MLHNRVLPLLLVAVTVLVMVRGEAGEIASDAVQNAINEAVFKKGPPMPDVTDTPPKKEKKKRVVNKSKNKKKSSKDWNKIDVNAMSEDWEDGDDEDELEHEYERIQRIAKEKAARASKVLKSGNNKKIKKVMESGELDTKGGMVFLTLTDLQPDGTPWDSKTQDKMCGRWSALLRTASLAANVYNMEPGQVLLQVDKGWMFNDVMKFIMTQPEVVKGYKDGKDYLPSMYLDDDEL
mmetsp:Transcript_15637/g.26064  ORF Transcript_15637/g.26064 Transcript_15637/m.26064 type:complete len:236 (-) Transcript_15637:64-771(-)